jgi:hypothetical protein
MATVAPAFELIQGAANFGKTELTAGCRTRPGLGRVEPWLAQAAGNLMHLLVKTGGPLQPEARSGQLRNSEEMNADIGC